LVNGEDMMRSDVEVFEYKFDINEVNE